MCSKVRNREQIKIKEFALENYLLEKLYNRCQLCGNLCELCGKS
jgi:hypothetical protein